MSEAKPPSRRFHPHPERRLSIKLLKFGDVLLSRVYHNLTVLSPERIPKVGPAILICNHTSGLDPFLLQSTMRRTVVWMMAKEYYELKFLRPAFNALEAIPVDRGARDSGALRSALRALQDGRVLGIFPEGRIEKTRELLPFQPGVVQIAQKADVPVCPAFLDGTQHGVDGMIPAFLRRQRAVVRFGPPVRLEKIPGKEGLTAAMDALRQAMWALRSPAYADL